MENIKIKTAVKGLELFSFVYLLNRDTNHPVPWLHNPCIEQLVRFAQSSDRIYLTFLSDLKRTGLDVELDGRSYSDDYVEVDWADFALYVKESI